MRERHPGVAGSSDPSSKPKVAARKRCGTQGVRKDPNPKWKWAAFFSHETPREQSHLTEGLTTSIVYSRSSHYYRRRASPPLRWEFNCSLRFSAVCLDLFQPLPTQLSGEPKATSVGVLTTSALEEIFLLLRSSSRHLCTHDTLRLIRTSGLFSNTFGEIWERIRSNFGRSNRLTSFIRGPCVEGA